MAMHTGSGAPRYNPIEPNIPSRTYPRAQEPEAQSRGWTAPAGSIFYSVAFGICGVQFFQPGDDQAAGVGPARLYSEGLDGRYLGDQQPWVGTAADIFLQAQFPLHSGRILGLPDRILISIMGDVVATLSVIGVVIWLRKRRAKIRRDRMAAIAPYQGQAALGVPAE
jgi:uncharacterized iron-regulated membrane protein